MNKLIYNAPSIKMYIVEIEESIATGSNVVNFGGDNNNFNPEVVDWEESTEYSGEGFML
ncbi:hypothetical protein J5U18_08130 [Sphingobacteriaceae bacterium WQ 2009]|uniref:Uncharacterized protein n=1 Tax=Rhinopithecimicrobium faecis TaxID=2820698 RepID=A0A8T4HFT3_9SPHI|nr:hypothetical protein [Sphingobacteriaceae bacterium WQ 2009]